MLFFFGAKSLFFNAYAFFFDAAALLFLFSLASFFGKPLRLGLCAQSGRLFHAALQGFLFLRASAFLFGSLSFYFLLGVYARSIGFGSATLRRFRFGSRKARHDGWRKGHSGCGQLAGLFCGSRLCARGLYGLCFERWRLRFGWCGHFRRAHQ